MTSSAKTARKKAAMLAARAGGKLMDPGTPSSRVFRELFFVYDEISEELEVRAQITLIERKGRYAANPVLLERLERELARSEVPERHNCNQCRFRFTADALYLVRRFKVRETDPSGFDEELLKFRRAAAIWSADGLSHLLDQVTAELVSTGKIQVKTEVLT